MEFPYCNVASLHLWAVSEESHIREEKSCAQKLKNKGRKRNFAETIEVWFFSGRALKVPMEFDIISFMRVNKESIFKLNYTPNEEARIAVGWDI